MLAQGQGPWQGLPRSVELLGAAMTTGAIACRKLLKCDDVVVIPGSSERLGVMCDDHCDGCVQHCLDPAGIEVVKVTGI